ncbi:TonB-dependent receptor plug domain-containing protein [Wenyingzhuangia sp. IMCC45574]
MQQLSFKRKFLILLFLILSSLRIAAQKAHIEKIYAHTDRTFYFPGETIWFKGYITNPQIEYSDISNVLHAHLISPKGDVIDAKKFSIKDGAAYGDFRISERWSGGMYKLKLFTKWSKNYGEQAAYTKEITIQKIVKPNLLLKLEFEKKAYGAKDLVQVNFKVENLKNYPLKHKTINYTIAIKGKKFFTSSFKTDENGKCKITFQLPETLNTQDVILNVLIPYKGTSESISRSVPVILNNVNLQFLPESGNLLANTNNKVAFKAVNEHGKPADISGVIIDSNNQEVGTFKSFHDGMGSFSLTPKTGTEYKALILKPFVSNTPIHLPIPEKEGTILSLINSDDQTTTIKITSNSEKSIELTVKDVGKILHKQSITLDKSETFFSKEITINTHNFPQGITSFTITDLEQNPLAERLIYLNPNKQLKVKIDLENDIFNIREKVKVNIKTLNENNQPVPSNLSISVADNQLMSVADDKQDHIISSLLVSSELKGKIHEPIFYFDKTKKKATKALDYLMLTHGWRKYIKHPIYHKDKAKHKAENKSIIKGIVVNEKNEPITAQLILELSWNKAIVFDTEDDGTFQFEVPNNYNSSYTLLAHNKDNLKLKILDNVSYIKDTLGIIRKTLIDSKEIPSFQSKVVSNKNAALEQKRTSKQEVEEELDISEETLAKKGIANVVKLDEESSSLDEVVVIGYGTVKKSEVTGAVTTIRADQLMSTPTTDVASALQGQIAGVNVISSSGSPGEEANIVIRGFSSLMDGNSSPLFVVDGVPFDSDPQLSINQIETINVLKDAASAAIYGTRGANGVILISTKNGYRHHKGHTLFKRKLKFNFATRKYKGIQKHRFDYSSVFYRPIYPKDYSPLERTDFRNTIYWNPIVQTDENGEANLNFYNSEAITSFKITTEGISATGLVGRDETFYATKKMVNVDYKLPNYLSVGDEVILPVTISNESDKDIKGSLSIALPKGFIFDDNLKDSILVKANSFVLKNIKLKPTQRIHKSFIQASFKTKKYQDRKRNTIGILRTSFPKEASLSGYENKKFSFNLENVIPGTLDANAKVNVNVVSDVTDGIKSMIRYPWGCFEQVSSVTYPNILVLKYLQKTKQAKKRTERKARIYIREGYSKLMAYRIKDQGFDWFGNVPYANEGLTAYGLMELNDMKDVYDKVDTSTFNSILKWLLSRRDGKGNFLQNKGKYGYSSTTKATSNAYILYAFSEVDPKINLVKEYELAYKEALKSKDTYRMVLLALAAVNYGETIKANTLYKEIKTNIKKFGLNNLPAESTITRSYNRSKNIETNSLILLYLQKTKHSDFVLEKRILNHILSKRYYSGFGNTQATSLALKALLEYAIKNPKKEDLSNDIFNLSINDSIKSKALSSKTGSRIYLDSITKYFTHGTQKIKANFSNHNNPFPYQINVRWNTTIPDSSPSCLVNINTDIDKKQEYHVGDNLRMNITVKNKTTKGVPMTTALIGIPSGLTPQPWQLKEIVETKKVAYYEIFENYLVFYWREIGPKEQKVISLDLKADFAGKYTAPPSSVYLYYDSDHKKWIKGNDVEILE